LESVDLSSPYFILAAVVALAIGVFASMGAGRTRKKLRARLLAEWGQPHEQQREMSAISAYHESLVGAADDSGSVDDRTWDDLELDRVFAWADRTESAVGQQRLYRRLRMPVTTLDPDFDDLVGRLGSDAEWRLRLQLSLNRGRSRAGWDLWRLTDPEFLVPERWYVIVPLLTLTVVASFCIAPWHPAALLVAVAILLANFIARARIGWTIGLVVVPFRQLGPLLTIAADLGAPGAESLGSLSERLREPLPALRRLRRIAWWLGRGGPSGNELLAALYEYLNLFFLLDANAIYFGARELRAQAGHVAKVIAAVGDVDVALCVASIRAEAPTWCRPEFVTSAAHAVMAGVRHPLVVGAVANTVEFGPLRGLIVTGSNMSGKSTFLRTVGINAVLATTLGTCLAERYVAPPFRVRSCIGREDDLSAGKSYYLVEVESVLQRVRESAQPEPTLFLFDELFRGTNTIERIAAGEAVLRALIDVGHEHIVLAATHDADLVALLDGEYLAVHFDERVTSTGLTFDYLLKPGPATTRNAIALLRLQGAPPELVVAADARAAALDAERLRRRN
jgi:hypothetical protein